MIWKPCAVQAGEISALIGLVEMLSGQTRLTVGTILINKAEPEPTRADTRARLGVLLNQNTLYPRLSVRGNLTFFARLYNISPNRVEDILLLAGLADQLKKLFRFFQNFRGVGAGLVLWPG